MLAMGLGTQLLSGMVVCTAAGWWVDRKIGGGGRTWTLVGILAGLVYGGYEVWCLIRVLTREEQDTGKGPDRS